MYPQLVIKFAIVIAFGALFATTFFQNTPPASAAPDGLLISVNDTADLVDTKPGDGKCLTANNTCTLRAAIMEANKHQGTDVIHLQANATYTLTRVGNDDNRASIATHCFALQCQAHQALSTYSIQKGKGWRQTGHVRLV